MAKANSCRLLIILTSLLVTYHLWVFTDAIRLHIEIFSASNPIKSDFETYIGGAARLLKNPDELYGSYPYPNGILLQLPGAALMLVPLVPLSLEVAWILFEFASLGAVIVIALLAARRFKGEGLLKACALVIVLAQPLPLLPFPPYYQLFLATGWLTALISPSYFHNYYWDNTNMFILLFLTASFFLPQDIALEKRLNRLLGNEHTGAILSAILFALGSSFKMTSWVFALPWLWYNRRELKIALPVLITTMLIANSVFLFHPKSLLDYFQMLNYVTNNVSNKPLQEAIPYIIEAHHFVWVYDIPIIIGLDLYRIRKSSSQPTEPLQEQEVDAALHDKLE